MNTKAIVAIAIALVISLLALIGFSMSVNIKNREIDMREGILGQQKKTKTHHTNMWNILKEQAQVTDQYKEAFEKIFPEIIAGRYEKGDGSLMKWIQEANPDFKTNLYEELMQSIRIERNGFINEQDRLIDMQREHTAYLRKWPNTWFLDSSLKPVEIQIVSSTRTNEAFEKGVEDDIELFDKKKEEKN